MLDINQLQNQFQRLDELSSFINEFRAELPSITRQKALKSLELNVLKDNIPLMLESAKQYGLRVIDFSWQDNDDVTYHCFVRYIISPILYKLGLTQKAANLKAKTFQQLFPTLHNSVLDSLNLLSGDREKTMALFSVRNSAVALTSSRVKSTDSIWHKIDEFDQIGQVRDYLGVRWTMNILPHENRCDALINGLRLAPKNNLIGFRNQLHNQKTGFDREPVMKLYYQFDQLFLELQILGGDIDGYMSAKGYTDHKTKLALPPRREMMSEAVWNARLGMCIDFFETNNKQAFYQLMLDELIGVDVNYDMTKQFVLDVEPSAAENRAYTLPNSDVPAFACKNSIIQ